MLIRCLDDYIMHLQANPQSLIARYYGLFKVKTPFFKPVYIVLMGNVMMAQDPEKIMYTFDLKGSSVSRSTRGLETSKAV